VVGVRPEEIVIVHAALTFFSLAFDRRQHGLRQNHRAEHAEVTEWSRARQEQIASTIAFVIARARVPGDIARRRSGSRPTSEMVRPNPGEERP
jgi:hypothetical protein